MPQSNEPALPPAAEAQPAPALAADSSAPVPAEAPAVAAEPAPTIEVTPSTEQPAAPAKPRDLDPAACTALLKKSFPALFTGAPKPIKLRIQADIQARMPGVFSKPALSGFLRRYTGSTSYLIALTRAKNRFDLDGQPDGELTEEHRNAAVQELERRRGLQNERRAQEDAAHAAAQAERQQRAAMLRAFETTTLTRGNFCALKGIESDALDALLEVARRERAEAPPEPVRDERRPHPPRGPDNRGGPRGPDNRGGPRGPDNRSGPRGPDNRAGPRGPGGAPRPPGAPGNGPRRDGDRGPQGPRPPRPPRG